MGKTDGNVLFHTCEKTKGLMPPVATRPIGLQDLFLIMSALLRCVIDSHLETDVGLDATLLCLLATVVRNQGSLLLLDLVG